MSPVPRSAEEIERDVIATISRISKVPAEQLTPEIDLRRDLRLDSLMGLKILAALEKRYGFTIPEEEIDRTRTVGAAVAMVRKMAATKG